jgi:hypothetical protein
MTWHPSAPVGHPVWPHCLATRRAPRQAPLGTPSGPVGHPVWAPCLATPSGHPVGHPVGHPRFEPWIWSAFNF